MISSSPSPTSKNWWLGLWKVNIMRKFSYKISFWEGPYYRNNVGKISTYKLCCWIWPKSKSRVPFWIKVFRRLQKMSNITYFRMFLLFAHAYYSTIITVFGGLPQWRVKEKLWKTLLVSHPSGCSQRVSSKKCIFFMVAHKWKLLASFKSISSTFSIQ